MTARRAPARPVFNHDADPPTTFRIWHGIESEDPPFLRHEHQQLLDMAKAMLETRQRRFPPMVERGQMDAAEAQAEIATVQAIVDDWHWIITGEGQPAHLNTLIARCALLDQAIQTIASIARDRGGFSVELEDQAHRVIAMRWHLEWPRQTHAIAAFNHQMRREAAQPESRHAA